MSYMNYEFAYLHSWTDFGTIEEAVLVQKKPPSFIQGILSIICFSPFLTISD